jgi:predicted DNA-binding antitoxin AbrB/MazE fold protein
MDKPILDPKPTGRPHDWSYRKIQLLKKAVIRPNEFKNQYVGLTAPRDQDARGTCVGQSGAHAYDLLYIQLTQDFPTVEDRATFKKDVVDSLGTKHDVLFKQSSSAEAFYQVSRKIGNVTYPEGSELRYLARAWIQRGMNLETQWHTAKTPYNVWTDKPRQTSDGGLSPADADAYASAHKAEGWATIGDEWANASWDEVCDAIYEKGFVLGGIPVYSNYETMKGGNGRFPDPGGEIVGYHALCFYGYDQDNLYFLHSWGDWCGRYGSISRRYFNDSVSESVYIVILDSSDVKIAREENVSLTITVKEKVTGNLLPASIYVDGVLLGKSPQKIAVERGKSYEVEVKMTGYTSVKKKYRVTAKLKKSLKLSLSMRRVGYGD